MKRVVLFSMLLGIVSLSACKQGSPVSKIKEGETDSGSDAQVGASAAAAPKACESIANAMTVFAYASAGSGGSLTEDELSRAFEARVARTKEQLEFLIEAHEVDENGTSVIQGDASLGDAIAAVEGAEKISGADKRAIDAMIQEVSGTCEFNAGAVLSQARGQRAYDLSDSVLTRALGDGPAATSDSGLALGILDASQEDKDLAALLGLDPEDEFQITEFRLMKCAISALLAAAGIDGTYKTTVAKVVALGINNARKNKTPITLEWTVELIGSIGRVIAADQNSLATLKVLCGDEGAKSVQSLTSKAKQGFRFLKVAPTILQCTLDIANGIKVLGKEIGLAYNAIRELQASNAALARACKNHDKFVQCNRACGGNDRFGRAPRNALSYYADANDREIAYFPKLLSIAGQALRRGCYDAYCVSGNDSDPNNCPTGPIDVKVFNGRSQAKWTEECSRASSQKNDCVLRGMVDDASGIHRKDSYSGQACYEAFLRAKVSGFPAYQTPDFGVAINHATVMACSNGKKDFWEFVDCAVLLINAHGITANVGPGDNAYEAARSWANARCR